MKNIFLLLLLSGNILFAQETLTGFHDLKIGAGFETVKSLLDTKKVMNYYLQKEFEFYKKEDPNGTIEADYSKQAYAVLKTQKKYFTYLKLPVTSVLVSFDEANKVSSIFIVIPKTEANGTGILKNAGKAFGQTDCSYGYNPETMAPTTFYCSWYGSNTEVIICDWNGIGEMTYDQDIMVEIKAM